MSYVVTIRRPNGPPITPGDFRTAVERDASMQPASGSPDAHGSSCEAVWKPDEKAMPVVFVLDSGEVGTTTPSDAALRKMQDLARRLQARVIGEEGEDLTDVEIPERKFPAATGLTGCAVVIATLVAAFWWLLTR